MFVSFLKCGIVHCQCWRQGISQNNTSKSQIITGHLRFYRDLETPGRDLGWRLIFNSEGVGGVEMVHLFILVPSALGLVEIYTSYCRETSGLRRLLLSWVKSTKNAVGVGGRVLHHSPNGSCLIWGASALTRAWGPFRVCSFSLVSPLGHQSYRQVFVWDNVWKPRSLSGTSACHSEMCLPLTLLLVFTATDFPHKTTPWVQTSLQSCLKPLAGVWIERIFWLTWFPSVLFKNARSPLPT